MRGLSDQRGTAIPAILAIPYNRCDSGEANSHGPDFSCRERTIVGSHTYTRAALFSGTLPSEGIVQFAIEFFSEGSAGRRDLLDRMPISFKSVDRAETFAVTIAKNIKMNDRVADLCLIRDKRGRALREVRLTPLSDVPSAVRASSASDATAHKRLH